MKIRTLVLIVLALLSSSGLSKVNFTLEKLSQASAAYKDLAPSLQECPACNDDQKNMAQLLLAHVDYLRKGPFPPPKRMRRLYSSLSPEAQSIAKAILHKAAELNNNHLRKDYLYSHNAGRLTPEAATFLVLAAHHILPESAFAYNK